MMPVSCTESEYSNARLRLFREMLAVTRDLDDALTIEEVTSDNLRIIDSLVEARESLIAQIKELDQRMRAANGKDGEASSGASAETAADIDDIGDIAQELMVLQERIDKKLRQHRARTLDRVKEIRKRRISLSGYYNKYVASQPRYIDAKK